jgi:hypothetical protein
MGVHWATVDCQTIPQLGNEQAGVSYRIPLIQKVGLSGGMVPLFCMGVGAPWGLWDTHSSNGVFWNEPF